MAEYMNAPVIVKAIPKQIAKYDGLADICRSLEGPWGRFPYIGDALRVKTNDNSSLTVSPSGIWATNHNGEFGAEVEVSEKLAEIHPLSRQEALYLVLEGIVESARNGDTERVLNLNRSLGELATAAYRPGECERNYELIERGKHEADPRSIADAEGGPTSIKAEVMNLSMEIGIVYGHLQEYTPKMKMKRWLGWIVHKVIRKDSPNLLFLLAQDSLHKRKDKLIEQAQALLDEMKEYQ